MAERVCCFCGAGGSSERRAVVETEDDYPYPRDRTSFPSHSPFIEAACTEITSIYTERISESRGFCVSIFTFAIASPVQTRSTV
jgi:hypothetical protein